MLGQGGQVWDEGDGSGAAADNDNFFVGEVISSGPKLRVYHFAFEIFNTGDSSWERVVVVVITGAQDDEGCRIDLFVTLVIHTQRPFLSLARPVTADDFVPKVHILGQVMLFHAMM